LCQLEQSASGYGFNLHSEKGKQGRYVRAVDEGSTSAAAGLRSGDRIIEVRCSRLLLWLFMNSIM